MRILGGGTMARVPTSNEVIPKTLRCSVSCDDDKSCFNIWRTRNADEDDERIALGNFTSSTTEPTTEPWMTAILLVAFDHDKGPIIESTYPSNCTLTQAELDTVSHHSMPDSASMSMSTSTTEEIFYTFRIPRRVNANEHTNVSVASTRLLLAHTLFRQAPDKTTPRGYFQKSLVFITSTPYIGLPGLLLSLLASAAFSRDVHVLKQAVLDIQTWPDPRQDERKSFGERSTLLLPFLDELLSVEWTQSFLTSFAAPIARLYVPHHVSHLSWTPCSPLHFRASRSPSSILLSSSPWKSSSPSYPSTSLSSIALQKSKWDNNSNKNHNNHNNQSYYHRDHDDNHDPHERTSNTTTMANANNKTVTTAWPLVRPSSHCGSSIFHEVNPVVALAPVLDLLPAIWEIVMSGEPLLIIAPTPTACSSAVMSIMSLIHPLPFVGDWRPYLCIQDTDYVKIVRADDVTDLFPDGAVFGVTNRLMADTMNFPHVLHIYDNININNGGAGGGKLKSRFKPCLQRSRLIRQMGMRALVCCLRDGGSSDHVADAVCKFRLAVYDKMTRPFLRIFDRYLTPVWHVPAHERFHAPLQHYHPIHQHLLYLHQRSHYRSSLAKASDERYSIDPFDRRLHLISFNSVSFPTSDDMQYLNNALFRKGTHWKGKIKIMYQRFVLGALFREWFHAALLRAGETCQNINRKFVKLACERGCSVIVHHIRERERERIQSKSHLNGNDIVNGEVEVEVGERITDLARRVWNEIKSAENQGDLVLVNGLTREMTYLIENMPAHKRKLFSVE